MSTRAALSAILLLSASVSVSAMAQVISPGSGGQVGGGSDNPPTGAASTHTPGTPGASDTPGAFQARRPDDGSPTGLTPADIRALKKEAKKASANSAPSAKSSAPSK